MIERLRESGGAALGFKVVGRMTADDIKNFEPQIEIFVRDRHNKPIGILADLSQMQGADWGAHWQEMRFLQKYTNHIGRMSVVGADKWEETVSMLIAGAAILEAETRYFQTTELTYAWEWARGARHAEDAPVRQISPATGIWKDYRPEYTGL